MEGINSSKLQRVPGPVAEIAMLLGQEVDQHGSIIVAPADARRGGQNLDTLWMVSGSKGRNLDKPVEP